MDHSKLVAIRGTEINLHTYNRSLELCARMNYEVEVLDFIDELSTDDVLYDLGAAEGRFAIYAATKGITVIAFEPENRNYQVLSDNIGLNPSTAQHLTIHNRAVGEVNMTSTITIGQPWPGGHQKVVATGPGRIDFNFTVKEEQSVLVVSLDEFIETSGSAFPTAMKVDIDGSEVPFIHGAKKTLADPRLKKLIFELCIIDKSYTVINDFLQHCGFSEVSRHKIPNESHLFNIVFAK